MIAKRFLDIVIAALVLVLAFPLLVICCSLIAINLGRPVIFKQIRMGRHGKDFWIYKLRTMNDLRDENGDLLPDYMRRTKFGDFLRMWSLDELPQFMNVLLGEMSVVGPRPMMHKYLVNCNPEQLKRLEALPGLTGLAQIRGRKGLDYEKRFALDVWYVHNYSFLLDVKIIIRTIIALIRHEGSEETGRELCSRNHDGIANHEESDMPIIRIV